MLKTTSLRISRLISEGVGPKGLSALARPQYGVNRNALAADFFLPNKLVGEY